MSYGLLHLVTSYLLIFQKSLVLSTNLTVRYCLYLLLYKPLMDRYMSSSRGIPNNISSKSLLSFLINGMPITSFEIYQASFPCFYLGPGSHPFGLLIIIWYSTAGIVLFIKIFWKSLIMYQPSYHSSGNISEFLLCCRLPVHSIETSFEEENL